MNIDTATTWCTHGVKRGQSGPVRAMSHLHTQLHWFSLLSTQSHSANRHLQLTECDVRPIHLADVQDLHINSSQQSISCKRHSFHTDHNAWHHINVKNSIFFPLLSIVLLDTFSLDMLSLLPIISAIRNRLWTRDSMAVKQSRAWQIKHQKKKKIDDSIKLIYANATTHFQFCT